MAVTRRKGLPFVWITWVTGLIAGDQQCLWAAWFRARFKYDKREDGFDLAAWSAEHDDLVRARVREFEADGAKVRTENENWTRVPGETAVLIGKMDIVAERGALFTIADGKTGEQKKRDWIQMLMYLYMLPRAWEKTNLPVMGELFYKTGARIEVSPHEFTPELKKHAFGIIKRIGDNTEPPRSPSLPECARCDVACCPDRIIDDGNLTPVTGDF